MGPWLFRRLTAKDQPGCTRAKMAYASVVAAKHAAEGDSPS
jgi:hypothetical protein